MRNLLGASPASKEQRTLIRFLCGCLLAGVTAGVPAEAPAPSQVCSAVSATRSAVAQCLQRGLQEAEAAMTAALASTRQELFTVESGIERKQSLQSLSVAQRSFLEFRKANCAWHAARTPAGTGAGTAGQDCMILMTRTRVEELRARPVAAETRSQ
jgi:uncharacterized protein YecT (DUF1311 family)